MDFFTKEDLASTDSGRAVLTVERANFLLRDRGVPVECVQLPSGGWYASTNGCMEKTHTGILIGMRPIEKDTPEIVLREIVQRWNPEVADRDPLIVRAKKVLEEVK